MGIRSLAGGAAATLAAALLVLPAPAPAASGSFDAVADTYTDASRPTTSYGTKRYVKVDGSPDLNAYLKFQVDATSYESAILQFYAESSSSQGFDVVAVPNNTWSETSVTAGNAPALGAVIASTGAFTAGTWVAVDVSGYVTGPGTYSIGFTGTHGTAMKVTSSEGTNKPRLVVPGPSVDQPFTVTRSGSTYTASNPALATYTGTLKSVVERAVADLELNGGGTVQFTAGDFDLGSTWFEFYDVNDVVFAGMGPEATTLRNWTDAATDTEPFDFRGAYGVTVRDLTVRAGGPVRFTSDALDFDQGNDVVVDNVTVTESRGRAIVFDGKNDAWNSSGNRVSNCVVTGVPSDGIELLASTDNVVEGCVITGVGGHGIQLAKSSTLADQPNKLPSRNVVRGNVIDESGQDGINVHGGNDNTFLGNTVTNSSDDTTSRDGIRFGSADGASCNGNQVRGNASTDNQVTKTQRYGLHIASSLCVGTVVGADNVLTGNRVDDLRDVGTGTVFE